MSVLGITWVKKRKNEKLVFQGLFVSLNLYLDGQSPNGWAMLACPLGGLALRTNTPSSLSFWIGLGHFGRSFWVILCDARSIKRTVMEMCYLKIWILHQKKILIHHQVSRKVDEQGLLFNYFFCWNFEELQTLTGDIKIYNSR